RPGPQPQPPPKQQPAPPQQQVAKLQSPPVTQKPSFSTQGMSAGKAIEEASRAAAASRSKYPGENGDLGLGQRQNSARMGPLEITTDTQGVDVGPYLQRVLHVAKETWCSNTPASA